MSKRKGESYLGGHTVISLSPKTVESNLALSAEEERIRKLRSQELFDKFKARSAGRIAKAKKEINEDIVDHAERKLWESANSRRETPRDPNNPYQPSLGYWKANLGEIRPWTGGEGFKQAWTRWRMARRGRGKEYNKAKIK